MLEQCRSFHSLRVNRVASTTATRNGNRPAESISSTGVSPPDRMRATQPTSSLPAGYGRSAWLPLFGLGCGSRSVKRERVIVNLQRSIFVSVMSALVLSACTTGSGDIVTEDRTVDEFDRIEISSAVTVELVVEPGAETTVSVVYDDNLIDRVKTEVRSATLFISVDGNIAAFGDGRFVSVTVDSLEAIEVSGAVDLKGSGELDTYDLTVSGASDVDLRDLIANEVIIQVEGASEVSIWASQSVTGDVSGASDVTVHGDPGNVNVETSGVSDLRMAD